MYQAPLRELRFALHELIGDEQLASFASCNDYSADFVDSVLDEAGKFAEEVLAPINRVGDTQGAKWTPNGVVMPSEFKNAYQQFAAGGWSQLRGTTEFGGQGAPAVLGTAVEELWASANLAFQLCPMLTQGAIEAIHQCGTQAQKEKYLPKMISGEWTGSMNLTESQAGSDLAAIRTRAAPEGDHYRLFGQKIFITYGDHDYTPNVIHLVLARIDGAPPGTRGLSLFIVPKVLVGDNGELGERNDVHCVSIEHKLGIHASPTCVLAFGDKTGAVGYLIGEANRGLEYMFIMMNAARLSVGLEGYALTERAYQQALSWARSRVQGRPAGQARGSDGKPLPIAFHADVKRMLLTMKANTDATRAMALYAALQLDIGHHAPDESARKAAYTRGELLIPIVKGFTTEMGVAMTSLGIQIHGGMGFIEETGAAQYLRDVRISTIYEGTTGIQAADLIGRKVARDGGVAMSSLIDTMQAELQATPNSGAALAAIDALREATGSILQAYKQNPEQALAVSVPYLMLSGLAIGGWMMAKSHHIATTHLDKEAEFYGAKRQIARCYVDQVLPETLALAKIVATGAASVVEADPALF
jgi:alkylation response protein AidB-like acyl-CoA dehydrogenase